jgi:hypothetical protein
MEELFKFQHLVMGACMSLPMTPFMGVLQVGHITPKKQTISMEALEQLQKKKWTHTNQTVDCVLICLTFLVHVRTHCFRDPLPQFKCRYLLLCQINLLKTFKTCTGLPTNLVIGFGASQFMESGAPTLSHEKQWQESLIWLYLQLQPQF